MRKAILVLCSFLLVFATAGLSSADVIGSGTFDLIVPSGYSYNVGYNYSGGYFAQITEYQNVFPYSSSQKSVYLDGTGSGSESLNGSSVSGTYNSSTGSETFDFIAAAPGPGVSAYVSVNFYNTISFYGELKDFGYDYSFNGMKDDTDDYLGFVIQMEISGHFDDNDESTYDMKDVYSDYGTYNMKYDTQAEKDNNYRTNWVIQQVTDAGATKNIAGQRTFDYSNFGERQWTIRWDFMASATDIMASGTDITDQTAAVPEPATMFLLASGLIGLAGFKKRFKK